MNDPKYQVGQEVEVDTPWDGWMSGSIKEAKLFYIVEIKGEPGSSYRFVEGNIRLPRPSEEEAWEKATMLIGKRGYERYEYCCLNGSEVGDWHRETRHQVYQILGSAGIKITDEVKADVRRLIGVADSL